MVRHRGGWHQSAICARFSSWRVAALLGRPLWLVMLMSLLVGSNGPAAASDRQPADSVLERAIELRRQGQISLSINQLRRACAAAPSQAASLALTAELGASLLQARRLDEADAALQRAHAFHRGQQRGRIALDLGNLAVLRGDAAQARSFYQEARQLADGDAQIEFPARLNLARLAAAPLAELDQIGRQLAQLPDSTARARWQINLGRQYGQTGQAGLAQAYRALSDASRSPAADSNPALQAEALDALAQLYEDQNRLDEALRLSRRALAVAQPISASAGADLVVQLEWRLARVERRMGRPQASLAAFQRAVQQIEGLRQDLPIEDDTGRSTFSTTLQPVYLGLVDALLHSADDADATRRTAMLRQAIDTVELLRQSELQDYLGDRCEVDAIKGGSATVIPDGAAVLYPIVLDDRLELLVETSAGISRHRSDANARQVSELATRFASSLRGGGGNYLPLARQLYDWVLRPVADTLTARGVKTLVVVPDGALRLVAVGAFHDGDRFAVERWAITTATGMSMTNTAPDVPVGGVLLAGLSRPGSVVEKLDQGALSQLLGPQAANTFGPSPSPIASRSLRSMRDAVPAVADDPAPGDGSSRSIALREALSLPGVGREVAVIGQIASGARLLDRAFTVDNFRREAESGRYNIIHLATHGVFGGRRESTYLLAYDDLMTLDSLQTLLSSDVFRRRPIELLSLSACETAEGDERSPLGISGAAIKARARSVLGSLWPVSDDAAVDLMAGFYRALLTERMSKAQALQSSQIALLRTPEYAHPFFWAPFILIGNWF